jgi:opacity protein-like surface antigen
MSKRMRAPIARSGLIILFIVGAAGNARAESFISPLIGFNFGGDSGCPTVTDCEDKRLNFGIGLGVLGSVLGYETEFAYAKDFFGDAPGYTSSVLTVMGNVMLVPNVGPVRPYGLLGLGMIRSRIESFPEGVFSTGTTDFGWDVGGGLFILFGDNVGVRGDIRYFHSFEDLEIAGIPLADTKLDFGRASAALVFKF